MTHHLFPSLAASLVILGSPLGALAAEHHTGHALEHAATAAAHGELGHADVLGKHAETALEHAKAAEKEHAEAHAHISGAVKSLEEAVSHGKLGHAELATKAAQSAVEHIKASYP